MRRRYIVEYDPSIDDRPERWLVVDLNDRTLIIEIFLTKYEAQNYADKLNRREDQPA